MNVSTMGSWSGWKLEVYSNAVVSYERKGYVYSWVTVNVCGYMVSVAWYTRLVGGNY